MPNLTISERVSALGFNPSDRVTKRSSTSDKFAEDADGDDVPSTPPDDAEAAPRDDGRVPVRVVVRCRPAQPSNAKCLSFSSEARRDGRMSLKIDVPESAADKDSRLQKGVKEFRCSAFINASGSQEDVFAQAVPVVDRTMEGYNGTIFCYGVTGSGKTHTISGPPLKPNTERTSEEDGIAQRVARHVFEYIAGKTSQGEVFIVEASYLEIYSDDGKREQLIDLLADNDKTKLEVKRDPFNFESFVCDGLLRVPITSPDEMIEAMQRGQRRCNFMETSRNCLSSRSHCLFMLTMEYMENTEDGAEPVVRRGKLMLVDLAGSESIKKVHAADDSNEDLRKSQAIGINRVLTSLGTVVRNMNIGMAGGHRDSALTMVLHDCLGGNARALLVANLGPECETARETLGTLNFAQQMMAVRNMASINTVAKDQSHILQMRARHADIIKLLKDKAAGGQEETAQSQAIKQEMEDINKKLLTKESAEKTLETMRDEQMRKMDEIKADMTQSMVDEMDKMRRQSVTDMRTLHESFHVPLQQQAQEYAAQSGQLQQSLTTAHQAQRAAEDEASVLRIRLASIEERAKMMQERHEDLLMQKSDVDEERKKHKAEAMSQWERSSAMEKYKAESEVQAGEIARLRAQASEDAEASRKTEASWRKRESDLVADSAALQRQVDEQKRDAEIQTLKRENEALSAATQLRLQMGKLESELAAKVSKFESELATLSDQHAATLRDLKKQEAETETAQKKLETACRNNESTVKTLQEEIEDCKAREAELIHMLNEMHHMTMSSTQ